ncbi:MAG: hypothetical protein ABH823_02185, partial [bacterium]
MSTAGAISPARAQEIAHRIRQGRVRDRKELRSLQDQLRPISEGEVDCSREVRLEVLQAQQASLGLMRSLPEEIILPDAQPAEAEPEAPATVLWNGTEVKQKWIDESKATLAKLQNSQTNPTWIIETLEGYLDGEFTFLVSDSELALAFNSVATTWADKNDQIANLAGHALAKMKPEDAPLPATGVAITGIEVKEIKAGRVFRLELTGTGLDEVELVLPAGYLGSPYAATPTFDEEHRLKTITITLNKDTFVSEHALLLFGTAREDNGNPDSHRVPLAIIILDITNRTSSSQRIFGRKLGKRTFSLYACVGSTAELQERNMNYTSSSDCSIIREIAYDIYGLPRDVYAELLVPEGGKIKFLDYSTRSPHSPIRPGTMLTTAMVKIEVEKALGRPIHSLTAIDEPAETEVAPDYLAVLNPPPQQREISLALEQFSNQAPWKAVRLYRGQAFVDEDGDLINPRSGNLSGTDSNIAEVDSLPLSRPLDPRALWLAHILAVTYPQGERLLKGETIPAVKIGTDFALTPLVARDKLIENSFLPSGEINMATALPFEERDGYRAMEQDFLDTYK